jgi:hypothetical protein
MKIEKKADLILGLTIDELTALHAGWGIEITITPVLPIRTATTDPPGQTYPPPPKP